MYILIFDPAFCFIILPFFVSKYDGNRGAISSQFGIRFYIDQSFVIANLSGKCGDPATAHVKILAHIGILVFLDSMIETYNGHTSLRWLAMTHVLSLGFDF